MLTSYSNSMYEMPARYIVSKHDLICIEKQIMLTAHVQYVILLGIAPKTVLSLLARYGMLTAALRKTTPSHVSSTDGMPKKKKKDRT